MKNYTVDSFAWSNGKWNRTNCLQAAMIAHRPDVSPKVACMVTAPTAKEARKTAKALYKSFGIDLPINVGVFMNNRWYVAQ